jgi:hypothetical protein
MLTAYVSVAVVAGASPAAATLSSGNRMMTSPCQRGSPRAP